MGMKEFPETDRVAGGKVWSHYFEKFSVKVYVPDTNLMTDIINYGYKAPFLCILPEKELSYDEIVAFSEEKGFANIARKYATSVVFIYPACGSWKDAPYELYVDLIAQTRIHQYYKDGVVTSRNRFNGEWEEFYIRGAKYRVDLYGYGDSADFIARNYLKTVEGEFLWGPGEITPAVCTLERLSEIPLVQRRDIPIVSVNNSEEINEALKASCDRLLIKDREEYEADFKNFTGKYRRWCGNLEIEADYEELGLIEEPGCVLVKTSSDNSGDDQGTQEHLVGYVAYYNKGLLEKGPLPTVLVFHGGGDSAMYIADQAGWYAIANKYNFLCISIENHLNSTATEMIELIDKLKEKYPIDMHHLYGSGFSMGGCKSWDLFQEYPEVFAALAPMDATFELGLNVFGKPSRVEINRNIPVPVFYSGGELTPLPELPFQAQKCYDRIKYVFEVNNVKTKYDVKFEDVKNWENKIWGISGDRVVKLDDPTRGSVLTMNYFDSEDGVCRTILASIDNQGHECRPHTCEQAWLFMSQFSR